MPHGVEPFHEVNSIQADFGNVEHRLSWDRSFPESVPTVSAQRKCHSLRGVRCQFPAKRKRHKAGAMVAQDRKRARRKRLSLRLAAAPSAIVVLCTASSGFRGISSARTACGGTCSVFHDRLTPQPHEPSRGKPVTCSRCWRATFSLCLS